MNAERLAEIKARLEGYETAACNPATEQIILLPVSDLRDLITALEVAQESIADQDADIKRLEDALLSINQAWQGIK